MKSFGEFLIWLGKEGRARTIILSPEDFLYLWERVPPDCRSGGRIWISGRCIETTRPEVDTMDLSAQRLFGP